MSDDIGTRSSHRMAAVELMQRSTVAMNSGYPDHEQVRHLDTRALTHALLALSAPVEESTAPVSEDTGEGRETGVQDDLTGTYTYGGVEYRLDAEYHDDEGDVWGFHDRLSCGMPRMACSDVFDVYTLPHVLEAWGPLIPMSDPTSRVKTCRSAPLCELCDACHDIPDDNDNESEKA